jgi:hypothetical protein
MPHVAVKSDPTANAAFDKLIKSGDFKSLGSDTRIAVLSQASNYPDSRSIGNLERLTRRQWFRGASLGDQQRSAKIVGFASQDTTANTTITNNALRFILTNSHLTVIQGSMRSASRSKRLSASLTGLAPRPSDVPLSARLDAPRSA